MTPKQRAKLKRVVEKKVATYRASGIPEEELSAWAWEILEADIHRHDPDKARLQTWAGWYLKKMRSRVLKRVTQEEGIERIPEHRGYQIVSFCKTRSDLAERLQRQPTEEELAVKLNWSVREVGRMQREIAPANLNSLLTRLGAGG